MVGGQRRFTLGVDIDQTLADYTDGLRTFLMREMNLPREAFPEPTDYAFWDCGWPLKDQDHFMAMHSKAVRMGMLRSLWPLPGAAEAMHRLHKADIELVPVTHRLIVSGDYVPTLIDSAMWFDTHQIPFDGFVVYGDKHRISFDAFVDDSPSKVEAIRAGGVECFVFDAPYNQHVDGPRIQSWETDGVEQILELAEGRGFLVG